jgi:hypothetical protein
VQLWAETGDYMTRLSCWIAVLLITLGACGRSPPLYFEGRWLVSTYHDGPIVLALEKDGAVHGPDAFDQGMYAVRGDTAYISGPHGAQLIVHRVDDSLAMGEEFGRRGSVIFAHRVK